MTVRQRTWLLTALLLGLGAIAVGVGATALGETFAAMDRHSPVIEYRGLDVTACLAGAGLLAIGAIGLLPIPADAGGRRRKGAERPPLALPLMIVAAVLIIGSPIGGSIGRLVVDSRATSIGYAACPLPANPRRQPDRWALVAARGLCPA